MEALGGVPSALRFGKIALEVCVCVCVSLSVSSACPVCLGGQRGPPPQASFVAFFLADPGAQHSGNLGPVAWTAPATTSFSLGPSSRAPWLWMGHCSAICPLGGAWQCLWLFWGYSHCGMGDRWTSSGPRPRMLPRTLQCKGESPPKDVTGTEVEDPGCTLRCITRTRTNPALRGLLSQSLEFNSPADNYTVCEGDNATLSCFIDEHVTRVAWLNRSNILYAGNDRWTSDPRVQLLVNTPEEFSILITQVGLGDEGLYTCSFQTRRQPYTTQVYLIVHVPARIVNISSPVTVNEGGNVNLLCLAVGRPEPTVTWRQLRDGFTSEGEILEISDIQRGQAGEYECVTHNGVNSAPDSRRVLVTVNYPPTITDVTSARTAPGRAALLRCEAMAVPPADFQWYKDDRLLSSGTAEGLKVQTERTRSMLLFANVSARHYGNYTCRAANRLGASSASMRLLRPGSLENSAPRPPGPLTLLSALGWLWWRM